MPFDAAMGRGARLVAGGDVPAAVEIVPAALAAASPGNVGWTLAIDPLLALQRNPAPWAHVLATLRERAM